MSFSPILNLWIHLAVFTIPWHCWHLGPGNFCLAGTCPVHNRLFSSNPDLYPMDASSILSLTVMTKNVSRCCQRSYGSQNCPWWRATRLEVSEVVQSCATLCNPWTVAHQAPLSMELPRQQYWSGLPFPFPGDLPVLGIEPRSPA